jgi:pyruvate carboxylase
MPSTRGDATLEEITTFFDAQGGNGIVIKAVGGGGGRGMRVVTERAELAEAYTRCKAEARSAFGMEAVYGERLVVRARHIEVQIVGDGQQAIALGERDCTLQRRFQKLVEIAPSPVLLPALREQVTQAALTMARRVGYRSLGTFEFLVEEDTQGHQVAAVFIEANPRLQVEHTVTEQVTGVDLVATQMGIAQGRSLQELGWTRSVRRGAGLCHPGPHQRREHRRQGMSHPPGLPAAFDAPSGLGVRVDTHGYGGYTPSPHYDTLLAKLIVTSHSASLPMPPAAWSGRWPNSTSTACRPICRCCGPWWAARTLHARTSTPATGPNTWTACWPACRPSRPKTVPRPVRARLRSARPPAAAVEDEALENDSWSAVRASPTAC